MSFSVDEFRNVEGLVQDRSIERMSVDELKKLKESLVTNTPSAEVHPIMQTRWDRAYAEVSSEINSKIAKRRFYIAIGISTVILLVGLVNLVRGFL